MNSDVEAEEPNNFANPPSERDSVNIQKENIQPEKEDNDSISSKSINNEDFPETKEKKHKNEDVPPPKLKGKKAKEAKKKAQQNKESQVNYLNCVSKPNDFRISCFSFVKNFV